jgi:hypothetical protein
MVQIMSAIWPCWRLAVDAEGDRAVRFGLVDGDDGGDRGAGVEALGRVPGVALGLGGGLQVAAGQVDPDRVAEDVVHGLFDGDVGPARLQGDHQLDLVVQVVGGDRVGDLVAQHHGVGRLGEEERRIAVVAAHLARWAA